MHGGMQRCAGFGLDNIFSLSECVLFEYLIKGHSIFLYYYLLVGLHYGRCCTLRDMQRCAEVHRGVHGGV